MLLEGFPESRKMVRVLIYTCVSWHGWSLLVVEDMIEGCLLVMFGKTVATLRDTTHLI